MFVTSCTVSARRFRSEETAHLGLLAGILCRKVQVLLPVLIVTAGSIAVFVSDDSLATTSKVSSNLSEAFFSLSAS